MKMKQLMAAALVALLGVFGASAADPAQALQGKVAGVNVTTGSGAPGSGAQIRVRGASSAFAGRLPAEIAKLAVRLYGPTYGVEVGAGLQGSYSAILPGIVTLVNGVKQGADCLPSPHIIPQSRPVRTHPRVRPPGTNYLNRRVPRTLKKPRAALDALHPAESFTVMPKSSPCGRRRNGSRTSCRRQG